MSDFENAVMHAAQKAVLKIISEGAWIQPDYANRVKMPPDFATKVWGLVNADAIAARMAERINEEVADRIVNHLAAEIATDVKQFLSVKERRESLRAIARQHIDSIAFKEPQA